MGIAEALQNFLLLSTSKRIVALPCFKKSQRHPTTNEHAQMFLYSSFRSCSCRIRLVQRGRAPELGRCRFFSHTQSCSRVARSSAVSLHMPVPSLLSAPWYPFVEKKLRDAVRGTVFEPNFCQAFPDFLMQTTWLDACCADAIWKRSKFRGRRDSWHLHLPKCPWLTSKFFGSTPNCTTCHRPRA